MFKKTVYSCGLLLIILIVQACQTTQPLVITNTDIHPLDALIKVYEAGDAYESPESEWPDISDEKRASVLAFSKDLLNRLVNINIDDSDLEKSINKSMLQLILENRITELEFNSHQFPLNAEGGFLTGILYGIRGRYKETDEQIEKYKTKLETLPSYMNRQTSHLKEGIENGKALPKLIINNCIDLIDLFIATPLDENYMVAVVPETHQEQIKEIVANTVVPAYTEFRTFLSDDYMPHALDEIGVAKMTGGKAYYEKLVNYYTTFDITPQEVFDTGMSEVKRIRLEMEAIIDELNFDGDFADFLEFLRTDEQFYPKSGRELLNRAAWITKEMEGKLPSYFNLLPRMPLTVKPVPDALAPNYTGGRYSPGSYDNNRAGQYWVNTYKLESRPFYVLPALSLHEGVPGHHTQIMLAEELEELPAFRKTYISAFGEGWGLYSEYLGKEAGMYKTPYERFGALTYEMWRACRLVVDPGMHYMGWTRDEAVEFMSSNTALSLHEVNTEIDRYIGWPAQAVSYKMGELKIRELRKRAEETLGDDFDIRSFHDAVLKNGSIPLSALEKVINQYIISKQQ
jgi:uncharacterized protein (DUF885 family)